MEDSISVVRTFYPVGHGAFYAEKFHIDDASRDYIIIFDCGCFEAAKPGVSSKDFKERIDEIINDAFAEGTIIDALFISHFHADHINGINHLMKRCNVKRVFIPKLSLSMVVETYLYYKDIGKDLSFGLFDRIIESEGKVINDVPVIQIEASVEVSISSSVELESATEATMPSGGILTVNKIWKYIPYYVTSTNDSNLVQDLRRELASCKKILTGNLHEDSKIVKDFLESIGIEKCKKLYEKHYGKKHNCYSMTLLSKPYLCNGQCKKRCRKFGHNSMLCYAACLYMGDFDAANSANLENLKNFYTNHECWDKIGLIQVPHHGSENNYNEELYAIPKFCMISAGKTDFYEHPNNTTLINLYQKRCVPIIVTEDAKTKQEFFIDLSTISLGDQQNLASVSNDFNFEQL